MTEKTKFLLRYSVLGITLVILDVFSKDAVQQSLADGSSVELLPFLQLVLVYNRGAAFGLLGDASGWQLLFFVTVGTIVSVVIMIRLARAAATQKWFEVALVLILAGAIGNLIDRIRVGYVVDFIELYYGVWRFPAFNVADMSIFFGASMLVLELLGILAQRKAREE
jgi:signal peptidase II